MLCKINDGHNMFKDNPIVLLTPLGRDGLPIEVPHAVYMMAFVDTKVLVTTANATCCFSSNGQVFDLQCDSARSYFNDHESCWPSPL